MKKQDIKELIKFFSETENVSKLKIKQDDVEIELEKEGKNTPTQQAEKQTIKNIHNIELPTEQLDSPSYTQNSCPCITSPMVGTFYQAPAPNAAPFAKVGDTISKGQTIAIIEAMKIMNEIEAEYDCKIIKVLVEDGQPVEFDMPLFEVEKI